MTVNWYKSDENGKIIEEKPIEFYCSCCGKNITHENQYCTEFVKCHETNEKFIHPVWCESCIKWIIRY